MTDDATLLSRASNGDRQAVDQLLELHRDRLRRMVALRMDSRLAQRVDPSDVVQEALAEAWRKLPGYLRQQAIPFYPWLRQIAWERLVQQQRRHLGAQVRDAGRERPLRISLSDDAVDQLGARLSGGGTSPSRHAIRNEMRQSVRMLLMRLDERDREVLILRFLEQLSLSETAAVLELTVEGARTRQRRALQRLSLLMTDSEET